MLPIITVSNRVSSTTGASRQRHLTTALLLVAFLVLAVAPLRWLVQTWYAPGYDSPGAFVIAGVCLLFFWSYLSPLRREESFSQAPLSGGGEPGWPIVLLLVSFSVRLLGQVLAINLLGAVMLALDVFALGLLLRLHQRARAVSPLWLAALFCFALPLEPMLQRTLGFGLQKLSAWGACRVLSTIHDNAGCEGVRLFIDDVDVLVDLPCSGARLMILLLMGFTGLAALKPLGLRRGIVGIGVTLLLALMGNTLRILLLAWGIRFSDVTGLNVMLDPWHSLVGLCIAASGITVLFFWVQRQRVPVGPKRRFLLPLMSSLALLRPARPVLTASALLIASVGVVSLHGKPLDVSGVVDTPQLPLSLAGVARDPLPLSAQEQRYFVAFGGQAVRAGYGEHSLLLVRTTSPLRHLHAPDVCFEASGYQVSYTGVDYRSAPAAVYRVRSPAGEVLRVKARFISSSGKTAHSVSEVVWHWFGDPLDAWTMVQTVSPWPPDTSSGQTSVPLKDAMQDFERAVERAFNLAPTQPNPADLPQKEFTHA